MGLNEGGVDLDQVGVLWPFTGVEKLSAVHGMIQLLPDGGEDLVEDLL